MTRVLLDTNLLISALLFGGIPYQVYQLGVEKKITMIASIALIEKLETVLIRRKFTGQFLRIGKTPFIVSGDDYLRDLEQYENIPIISASDFLARIS